MSPLDSTERKRAERERDVKDIQEAAALAETAAQYFTQAEQDVRQEGSARSLARFAYQVHKSGLDTQKFFDEVKQRVDQLDRITQDSSTEDDLDWALADIAAWQFLSGREGDGQDSLEKITKPNIKASALIHVGTKLIEKKEDPTKWLALAETLTDQLPMREGGYSEKDYVIQDWAQAGNRTQVERLIKKYYAEDPRAQQEELLNSAIELSDHGVKVGDIFLNAFSSELPLDEYAKRNLMEGLITTGHLNEASVLLLEPESGDTPELDEAWELFQQAQAAGDTAAATAAYKVIASVGAIDSELVKSAGVALANVGEEASANAMISLLEKEKQNLPPEQKYQKSRLAADQDLIRMNNFLQLITHRRTDAEKWELVGRFQQPLASAVKELLVSQVQNPRTRVDGLKQLALHLAKGGSNPNMFGIVDEIEKTVIRHPDEFEEDDLPRFYLSLIKHTAPLTATQQGNLELPLNYLLKTTVQLRVLKKYPVPTNEYLHERLWAAKVRIAVAATNAARDRLTRGHKTKSNTSAQLNKLPLSVQAQKLIAAIRP